MVEAAKEASKAVKKAFIHSRKTDDEYNALLESASEQLLSGAEQRYYVCQICGHIHVGTIPDHCPVCHAVPTRFKEIA
jgi:rubrerythrin